MFRDLKPEEIECRIGMVRDNGLTILLYKDARCDMNILDEEFGMLNWKREHSRDNKNCTVSLWDEKKQQWVSKEDTGTESNTEAEKGLASDSFKRACFNWGIGRELYTAPFIWINNGDCTIKEKKCYDKFIVQEIEIKEKKIIGLIIKNEKTGKICYKFGTLMAMNEDVKIQYAKQKEIDVLLNIYKEKGQDVMLIKTHYKVEDYKKVPQDLYVRMLNDIMKFEKK